MSDAIKLSSPATQEFWEIPVVYEDDWLLALDKPAGLLASPDRHEPQRPSLVRLLHLGIERGAAWARQRGLSYLMNAHRLEFETSGVLLLAKSRPTLVKLADVFGSEKPNRIHVALAQGTPKNDTFALETRLAPHPGRPGLMCPNRRGKRAITRCEVRERFVGFTLLQCQPLTARPHQISAHLSFVGLPLVGDAAYRGAPLLLSRLKTGYHLKPGKLERPLLARSALHLENLVLLHPHTGQEVRISAPWPKDLTVAVKYLRRFAPGRPGDERQPWEQAGEGQNQNCRRGESEPADEPLRNGAASG